MMGRRDKFLIRWLPFSTASDLRVFLSDFFSSVRIRHPTGHVPPARHGSLEAVFAAHGDVGSPRNASGAAAVPQEEGEVP